MKSLRWKIQWNVLAFGDLEMILWNAVKLAYRKFEVFSKNTCEIDYLRILLSMG